MHAFTINGKAVDVFLETEPGAPIIYLNTFSGEGQKVHEAAQAVGCPPFSLVAISNLDWNHDMVPWDSPAAFKKGETFTGGADDYMRLLAGEIIPRVEKDLASPPAWRGIAGYSFGWSVRPVCHLPGRCVLTGEVYVRLPVVSWLQSVQLLPRAEALARLHLLLPGGQRGQNPQSSPENSSGKYRGDPGFLPKQRYRHRVPDESRKPLCPRDRADGGRYPVAAEHIGDGLRSLFFE